jgi:hypothetical protein
VRARKREQDGGKYAARRAALIQEERTRIAELRQKLGLRIQLQLLSVLLVHQPKLLLGTEVLTRGKSPVTWPLVWDPLTESLEAPECPMCGRSTFELTRNRLGEPGCAACVTAAPAPRRR